MLHAFSVIQPHSSGSCRFICILSPKRPDAFGVWTKWLAAAFTKRDLNWHRFAGLLKRLARGGQNTG